MIPISDAFDRLKNWTPSREVAQSDEKYPFFLSCHVADVPALDYEIERVNGGPDLAAFWRHSESAELFKDDTYGQWGLRILSPSEVIVLTEKARRENPRDMRDSDLVIGEFYGDSDQLIIDTSHTLKGYFPVIVKLPIDRRSEWPIIASSFSDFLEIYIENQGRKFWEC